MIEGTIGCLGWGARGEERKQGGARKKRQEWISPICEEGVITLDRQQHLPQKEARQRKKKGKESQVANSLRTQGEG